MSMNKKRKRVFREVEGSEGLKYQIDEQMDEVMVQTKKAKIVIDGTQFIDRNSCFLKSSVNNVFTCDCGVIKTTLKSWRNHLGKKNRQKRRIQRLEKLQEMFDSQNISKILLPNTSTQKKSKSIHSGL